MARKDSKGRNLRNGEVERTDGRYMFRYPNPLTGKRETIYEYTLDELRVREKQVLRDLDDQIAVDSVSKRITLNEQFERYMASKELKDTTRFNYHRMWDARVRDDIGRRKVVDIKTSHIRLFYADLAKAGLKRSTIKLIHTMVAPALELAVDDDLIRKNPAKGMLGSYGEPSGKREALTVDEQARMMEFIAKSGTYNIYLPMITIMIGTCMRIGETIGLTWDNVDLNKREITVDHQLIYKNQKDGCGFRVSTPKTASGVRKIPMTEEVYRAFIKQRQQNFMLGRQSRVEIDGLRNFVFNTKNGNPMMPSAVNDYLKNIVQAYNKEEKVQAKKEHREPEFLPHISAHILRHTGCTRYGEIQMDPKVLQYVMGHADIGVTMNTYNHIAGQERIDREFARIERLRA